VLRGDGLIKPLLRCGSPSTNHNTDVLPSVITCPGDVAPQYASAELNIHRTIPNPTRPMPVLTVATTPQKAMSTPSR
jgi:hypothetical protein